MKEKRDAISIFFRQVRYCRICFNYVSFYIFISLVILQPTDGAKLYEDSNKHYSNVENGTFVHMDDTNDDELYPSGGVSEHIIENSFIHKPMRSSIG